jgi:transposase
MDKSSISLVSCCVARGPAHRHQRRFGAMTEDLPVLAEWLRQFGMAQVAMESSDVYRKPVWNIREIRFTIVLANARSTSRMCLVARPTRRMLNGSRSCCNMVFCGPATHPCEIIRDLSGLTRMRASLSQEASRISISRRIQKVLEDANRDGQCWRTSSP